MSADASFRKTIRLHHVSKRFDAGRGSCTAGVVALRDASVEIRAGEVLIVAGPRGAGKTTLLLCAAGLLLCDAGDIGHMERRALYVDLAHTTMIGLDWPRRAAILIDSCDDVGELNRARLAHAIDAALSSRSAVVLAARDARKCLSIVPASATVSVVHLRLGQIDGGIAATGRVHRVAEGPVGSN